MKSFLSIASCILISACSTPDSSSFRVGNIDYETLSKEHAVKETRLFNMNVKKDQKCPLQSSAETVSPLVLAGIGYVGKELIAFGKSQLEKRAEYLESDVILNGKAILTMWPSDSDEASTDLCLLVIAGQFGDSADSEVIERFRASQRQGSTTNGFRNLMAGYIQQIPGADDINGPFTGIEQDPSFLIEIKLSASNAGSGKWFYIATPTYMLYPSPLHTMVSGKASRKLSVEYSVGTAKGAIDLDGFNSGAAYETGILQQRYSITDQSGAEATTVATVKVIEGPDKMPTAKLMRDLARNDGDLKEWLDTKLKEFAEENADNQ